MGMRTLLHRPIGRFLAGFFITAFCLQNRTLVKQVHAALRHIKPGTTILLPEDAVGPWGGGAQHLWRHIHKEAARQGVTIALGTYSPTNHANRYLDAIHLIGARHGTVGARQPIPMAEWRPFDPDNSTRATWTHLGPSLSFGRDRPAAILICYEQLLVWPLAESFLSSIKPTVIVAPGNHWWVP